MSPGFFGRHGNVYIYVPNLIGYTRVATSMLAFALAPSRPLACVAAYFLGFVADELDGRYARKLGQTSTLGVVLDMVTDRLSTAGLLSILCMQYAPDKAQARCAAASNSSTLLRLLCLAADWWYMAFLTLLILDIFSHWFQMYSTLVDGKETHKDITSQSAVVRFYYSNRIFMGFCCVSCEVLYLTVYLLSWTHTPAMQPYAAVLRLVALGALPGVLVKQITNYVQLTGAMQALVHYDQQADSKRTQGGNHNLAKKSG
ncbi:hypothetical protein WJX72_007882 [[Myrmecia] bisecta]|uniref:CDP-diacylglycerol--inositol 3-phosphatidyltransferase n=1 Tax=[Myrmecia] bisecta TaxID=41462 RepID=A0AAW1PBV9_9CHLO